MKMMSNLLVVVIQRTVLHRDVVLTSLPLEVADGVRRAVPHAVLVVTVHHAGESHRLARLHHHQAGLRVYDEEGGSRVCEGQQGEEEEEQHDVLPQLRTDWSQLTESTEWESCSD